MTENTENKIPTYTDITIHRTREMKPISSFLNYYDNENTIATYYFAFISFFRFITHIPDLTLEIMDIAALKYLDTIQSTDEILQDLLNFRNSLAETHSSASINMKITVICS